MTMRTAGPDYWFIDPAYAGVDRLTEDECPMDEVHEGEDREAMNAEWDRIERATLAVQGMVAWLPLVGWGAFP